MPPRRLSALLAVLAVCTLTACENADPGVAIDTKRPAVAKSRAATSDDCAAPPTIRLSRTHRTGLPPVEGVKVGPRASVTHIYDASPAAFAMTGPQVSTEAHVLLRSDLHRAAERVTRATLILDLPPRSSHRVRGSGFTGTILEGTSTRITLTATGRRPVAAVVLLGDSVFAGHWTADYCDRVSRTPKSAAGTWRAVARSGGRLRVVGCAKADRAAAGTRVRAAVAKACP